MTLTLDPVTEKRIQREIDLGHYSAPEEVIAHALTLLTGEAQASEQSVTKENAATIDTVFGVWSGRGIDGLVFQQRMRDEW